MSETKICDNCALTAQEKQLNPFGSFHFCAECFRRLSEDYSNDVTDYMTEILDYRKLPEKL